MSGFTFGASTTQPQTSSLFGNASTAKPAFGGFSTPNPQNQQSQNQAPSTSLFGTAPTAPTNPAPSTNLFGGSTAQAAQPSTSFFGGNTAKPAQQSTSLFGGGNTQQQPVAGGSLFAASNQNQAPAASGGSLFGGGLFGQNQQQQQGQQTGATGGLFGSTTQQQQQQQQGQQGQQFGTTGGLFGSNQQQQQPQQNSQPGQFSFGASTSQQPQQNSLFNSTANLASSSTGGYGGVSAQPEPDIETRMMAVQKAWSTDSPDCRFKYFFYNVVDPGTTQSYGRPQGANDDAKWAKALRENPDPSCMVPVLATGWGDVKKRFQAQEHLASVHQQRVKEISQALSELTRRTSLSSAIRLVALQTHLTQLMHRLIHLASLTPSLIPILHSTAFRQEEGEVKNQLEGVKNELEGKTAKSAVGLRTTSGKGRLMGQVNELWGQVEEIRRRRRVGGMENGSGREGWLADEKALAEVAEILATQQMALQKLNDLVGNLLFDADVMRQGVGLASS